MPDLLYNNVSRLHHAYQDQVDVSRYLRDFLLTNKDSDVRNLLRRSERLQAALERKLNEMDPR